PTTPWFVAKYSIQLSYSRRSHDYMQKKQGFRENAEYFAADRKKTRPKRLIDTWLFLQLFAAK
ncbi:MAG: hypothetical protein RR100_11470, partial [Comamonas sp.]